MVGGVLSLFSRALLIFFSAHVATLSFFFFGGSSSRSMPAVDLELRLGVGGTVTPSPTEAGSEREEGPPILQLVVGGDSVESILRRLLRHSDGETLDPAAYNLARAEAQDRFEIQVEIIQLMAVLDHPGCRSFWIQHGARALDNPPISKGEGITSDSVTSGGIRSLLQVSQKTTRKRAKVSCRRGGVSEVQL